MIALKILGFFILWVLVASFAFVILYKLLDGEMSDDESAVVYGICLFSAPLVMAFAVCWLIAHLFYKVVMFFMEK